VPLLDLFLSDRFCCKWKQSGIKFAADLHIIFPHMLLNFQSCKDCIGVVVKELMCNQWERKGMHTDIRCSG
jgi:hypothetical protein